VTEGPAQWLSPSLLASGPTQSPGELIVTEGVKQEGEAKGLN